MSNLDQIYSIEVLSRFRTKSWQIYLQGLHEIFIKKEHTCRSTSGSSCSNCCCECVGKAENVLTLMSALMLVLTRMEPGVSKSTSTPPRLLFMGPVNPCCKQASQSDVKAISRGATTYKHSLNYTVYCAFRLLVYGELNPFLLFFSWCCL